jgi:hypothetical protein
MADSVNLSHDDRIEAEHALLAALCHTALAPDLRAAILTRLNNYHFVDPDHQVVHRALIGLRSMDNSEMFSALTQAVTRLGFPDLNLSSLFSNPLLSKVEIDSLLARL